jgi:hypothetical protein
MSKQTTDFSAVVAESQKQALAAITQAHESMLTLAGWGMGSMPATAASAWSLPKATDVVQAGYDFAGEVLEEQKAFALRLTEIASSRVEDVKKTVA